MGDLFDAHPREKSHFDDLGLTRIKLGELFHCLIQRENFLIALWGKGDGFIEFDATGAAAPLLAFPLPGVIHQDSAHRLSADGEKMGAPLPIYPRLIDQPQIRLMHQGRRLEGMVSPLVAEMPGREGFEFIVDKRHQLGRDSGAVAAF